MIFPPSPTSYCTLYEVAEAWFWPQLGAPLVLLCTPIARLFSIVLRLGAKDDPLSYAVRAYKSG